LLDDGRRAYIVIYEYARFLARRFDMDQLQNRLIQTTCAGGHGFTIVGVLVPPVLISFVVRVRLGERAHARVAEAPEPVLAATCYPRIRVLPMGGKRPERVARNHTKSLC
jgi:hypothetical protein